MMKKDLVMTTYITNAVVILIVIKRMQFAKILLVVLILIRLSSQGDWGCGGVVIDEAKQCKCGGEVLNGKYNKKLCCGPDTCTVDANGDGVCPDGITCNTSRFGVWNCGDILISDVNTCKCGSSYPPLDYDQYKYPHYTWCCPSEPCTYQDDGNAVCHNATIVQGRDKGCNGL